MKVIKSLFAIALACVLALGLFACAAQEQEEKPQVAQTPLAVAQSDPLAYLNALVGTVRGADRFTMEAPYGMDDIEAGNDTLQAAKDVVKGYATSYLNSSLTYNKTPPEGEEPVDIEARCPALFYALRQEDLLEEMKISDVLELRVAERLATLETDIAEGRNTSMKDASDQEKREYVLEQMGEGAVSDADRLFQIECKLSPDVIERLFVPADKEAILAQLALAEDYAVIKDYAVEPTELTLFATVNKAFIDADTAGANQTTDPAQAKDFIKELTFTQKANLTADATGAGAFADAGEFTIALTLTKTLRFKDIAWETAASA